MSISIEFQLTPRDMNEMAAASVKHIRRQRATPYFQFRGQLVKKKTALLILLLGMLIAAAAHILIPQQYTSPPAPVQTSSDDGATSSWRDSPWIPWIIIFGIICYVIFRIFRWIRPGFRLTGNTDPWDAVYRVTADNSDLVWTEPDVTTAHPWQAFHGFQERANVFLIYQDDARHAEVIRVITIPKRAFGSKAMLEEFSQLLRSHVQAFK